jgi:hypothetical protein
MSFANRAQVMGLDISFAEKGMYSYTDRHSEVIYRQLECGRPRVLGHPTHPTDGMILNLFAVFSKRPSDTNFYYIGRVSDSYQFVGNEKLVGSIKQSISDSAIGILSESPFLSFDLAKFRDDILLSSTVEVPEVGDILPCIIVQNGYNGTKAASVSYGISFMHNIHRLIYGFKFGEMRMVHLQSTDTNMRESLTTYISTFQENIVDVVRNNFSTKLTEEQMFATMDMLEELGKKNLDQVKGILEELTQGQPQGVLPSSWQMFVAIVKYASFHPNINIRRLLENAAESVLVVPPRMLDTLKQLERY